MKKPRKPQGNHATIIRKMRTAKEDHAEIIGNKGTTMWKQCGQHGVLRLSFDFLICVSGRCVVAVWAFVWFPPAVSCGFLKLLLSSFLWFSFGFLLVFPWFPQLFVSRTSAFVEFLCVFQVFPAFSYNLCKLLCCFPTVFLCVFCLCRMVLTRISHCNRMFVLWLSARQPEECEMEAMKAI